MAVNKAHSQFGSNVIAVYGYDYRAVAQINDRAVLAYEEGL